MWRHRGQFSVSSLRDIGSKAKAESEAVEKVLEVWRDGGRSGGIT